MIFFIILGLYYNSDFAKYKKIIIRETEKEIKKLLKESNSFIGQRLRVQLILKQNQEVGISKREVAKLAGVDSNSVQRWRNLYINTGIEGLLKLDKVKFFQIKFGLYYNFVWY